jgi:hypothetical protein
MVNGLAGISPGEIGGNLPFVKLLTSIIEMMCALPSIKAPTCPNLLKLNKLKFPLAQKIGPRIAALIN